MSKSPATLLPLLGSYQKPIVLSANLSLPPQFEEDPGATVLVGNASKEQPVLVADASRTRQFRSE